MQYLHARMRPQATRDITEYEYAKRQGFTGSLADFIQRKRSERHRRKNDRTLNTPLATAFRTAPRGPSF